MYASCCEFHGLVLVMYSIDVIASSGKVNSNSAMTPWQKVLEIGNINHKGDHFTSSPFWLGQFMTKMNTQEMMAGNVLNEQDFEENKIKFKQRSIEDFIGTSFVLIDADLLLIWMNKFQLWFRFHRELCPVLPAMLIIS